MTDPCAHNTDPLRLVRDGTHQIQRYLRALDPIVTPLDARRPEHAMVFAAAYAKYLKYFELDNTAQGDWQEFFASDVSAELAVVAIEDVGAYRTTLKKLLRSLEDPELPASGPHMVATLGAVFDCLGALARRLDTLKADLPPDSRLGSTLSNLIRSQLSPMLRRLIGYYLAGAALGVVDRNAAPPDNVLILGQPVESFDTLLTGGGLKSTAWPDGVEVVGWAAYATIDDPAWYIGAYGLSATPADQVNHLATHNLFTAVCETFLAVFARTVDDAGAELQATLTWNGHEPHYALFLAFLQLLEHARAETNTLTAKHLEFYYRTVLQLDQQSAEPAHAHVLVELAKHVDAHQLTAGTLLRAGKDDRGDDAHFAVDRDVVANRAEVSQLKSVYRHRNTPSETVPHGDGRIFATPSANIGTSWHPFAEKTFVNGTLESIDMPPAEVGFAIASHHLWMAEGTRSVDITLTTPQHRGDAIGTRTEIGLAKHKHATASRPVRVDMMCRLTTEKGWLEKPVENAIETRTGYTFTVPIDGGDPPITPHDHKVHGYGLDTSLPVLLVTLRHLPDRSWSYPTLASTQLTAISVSVSATGVKTLTLSNDHGTIDSSKPFPAFGATPTAHSSLVIGSNEIFQKSPRTVTLTMKWTAAPVAYKTNPTVAVEYLSDGVWTPWTTGSPVGTETYELGAVPQPQVDTPNLTATPPFSTSSRSGFIRLVLDAGFGTSTYPIDLAAWIAKLTTAQPTAPLVPTARLLTLDYTATQELDLAEPTEAGGRFFHIGPFGHAEQSLTAAQTTIPLLPQFRATLDEPAEGELYIGVRDLRPPQNLDLLFQVEDGTANPLVVKPDPHIHWTYLRGKEWVPFTHDAVADNTDGLLAPGIVTLAVPADATSAHTLLPAGMHWIRLAVASDGDAVCRLVDVAADALQATSVLSDNAATSHTHQLPPRTITKLATPDTAVKGITQPYPTFGGRPSETPAVFAARASERLRHKDRAIALWDYEHLILSAFPGIHQARCLNHTQFDPDPSGAGTYRELAAGHVTIVTIPDLTVPNERDPLRPYTSLRTLGEIERYLAARVSCFAQLHVRNPQFEEIRADLRVRFRLGVDETFQVNKLKQEITQFLSPWAFRSDARPTFNGRVYKSVLVNFIEDRPYVDYVSNVRLFHKLPGATADGDDLDEVVGARAISILVSVPADQHTVQVIRHNETTIPEHCACAPAAP